MQRLSERPLDPVHAHIKSRLGNVCKSLAACKGQARAAADYAEAQPWGNRDEVARLLKGSVAALGPADATGFASAQQFNLGPLVRPLTIVGRIPGVRHAPFDTRLISLVDGITGNFIGPGEPIPMSRALFSASLMRRKKVSSLTIVTKELAATSDPRAQKTIEDDAVGATVLAENQAFVALESPETDERPASIAYGAPTFYSTGGALANVDADLAFLIESLIANGSTLEFATWIMSPITASSIARLRGTGGGAAYPDISVSGGSLLGLPVITSGSIARNGSPLESHIILADGAHVVIADSGEAEVSGSQYAAVEMLDNPTNQSYGSPIAPIATTMVSMFQTESIAIKVTRFVNWAVNKSGAIAVLRNISY